ncbi:hypothetical protein [Lutibacter sp.]|uniref:hypothetical protein n=1 Tax=Lutibacter sp. TaxID=1925666 RepID=UPI0027325E2E|nr:hypothetical protein [Lutibacter sp.]MDP3313301.1 hypothetical protein [Lutibacter sp.]
MKRLSFFCAILLMVTFHTSCEKETTLLPENSEINNNSQPLFQRVTNDGLQFYFTQEEFGCNDLPTEDFEDALILESGFSNFLNQYSNSGFSPGGIISGVTFEIAPNINWVPNWGLYVNSYFTQYGPSYILRSNGDGYLDTNFVINFTENNVTEASMYVFNGYECNVFIEIYGITNNLIGEFSVFPTTNYGFYWAVSSNQSISKIILHSEIPYSSIGIDNISFGTCNNTDFDNDGCLNEEDPYPHSIMTETIIIGGINTGVLNKFESCSTMADEIDVLIRSINAEYTGANYDSLHKKFVTGVAQITYYWRLKRKITSKQRTTISNAAWNANIPFWDDK